MATYLGNGIVQVFGPNGEIVIIPEVNLISTPKNRVVQLRQVGVQAGAEVQSKTGHIICAVIWGLLGFPFALIGFGIICAGLAKTDDPENIVSRMGLIFFGIGAFFCILFGIIMCRMKCAHRKQIQRRMHGNAHVEERHPFFDQIETYTPSTNQNIPSVQPSSSNTQTQPGEQLTPYQRFMLLKGQQNSPNISTSSPYISTTSPHITTTSLSHDQPSFNVPNESETSFSRIPLTDNSTNDPQQQASAPNSAAYHCQNQTLSFLTVPNAPRRAVSSSAVDNSAEFQEALDILNEAAASLSDIPSVSEQNKRHSFHNEQRYNSHHPGQNVAQRSFPFEEKGGSSKADSSYRYNDSGRNSPPYENS